MPSPPTPPRRHRRIVLALALPLVLAVLAAWLAASSAGLRALAGLAQGLSGQRLAIRDPDGCLLGPLTLGQVLWTDGPTRVQLDGVHLEWVPARLLTGHLQVEHLRLDRVHVTLPPAPAPPAEPGTLRLPWTARIAALDVGPLQVNDLGVADALQAVLASDGATHRLEQFSARRGPVRASGTATVATAAPFALSASATLQGRIGDHGARLDLTATGPLATIDGRGTASGDGIQGTVRGRLTPFAPQPVANLEVHLAGVDPAAWLAEAPHARIDLDARLDPIAGRDFAVRGRLSARNRDPGPVDHQRLPLERLTTDLHWADGTLDGSDLRLGLPGRGEAHGRFRLQGETLHLTLQASQLDAAAVHSRLRPTRLGGPIRAELGRERQALEVDLTDPAFTLRARLARDGAAIVADRLELRAGDARLEASGRLARSGNQDFAANGTLTRFDPSRFVRGPSARLNARLQATGRLQPKPLLQLAFAFGDSRLAGQPLTGTGTVDLAWPTVPRADIRLANGPNRLRLTGSFGRPGDRLQGTLQAPQLAPYGLEGGVDGEFEIGGSLDRPSFAGRLRSALLGQATLGSVHDLEAEASLGSAADAPARLDLRLGRLDTAEASGVLQQVQVHGAGTRAGHQLEAAARLAGGQRIRLRAVGGLPEDSPGVWNGQLADLQLAAADGTPLVHSAGPSPLRLGPAQWLFGPARLVGSGGQGQIQASSGQGRLQLAATAAGPGLGTVSATLQAAMASPWRLDRQGPWQGQGRFTLPDLAWIGPWFGENWQSAGTLQGAWRLGGTPARPLLGGSLQGENLALGGLDQGLRLERGRLVAELADNLLQVRTCEFDSPLRPLPPALAPWGNAELAAVVSRPGHLSVRGQTWLLERPGAERGVLELHLDRIGALQTPDQWVVLSGEGRLSWQEQALAASARLKVDGAYWQLARAGLPQLSDDVVIRGSQRHPGTNRPRLDVDIETDLGSAFLFRGAGLESRLAGQIRLQAQGRDLPRASGSIRTVGGRFDAYGQQLEIERGAINFQGLLENPGLNVRAVRRGLAVEAGVEVGGSAKRPVVRLVSDPEMADAEKLSWLVLGHGTDQAGGADAGILLSAAGSILGGDSGGVVQQIKRGFGIDELGLRGGQIGDSGGRQASSRVVAGSAAESSGAAGQILTVGKRLSANTLLAYEQALGRTESVVKLTVNLSRQLSLVGRAGSDNALDLFYVLRFGR